MIICNVDKAKFAGLEGIVNPAHEQAKALGIYKSGEGSFIFEASAIASDVPGITSTFKPGGPDLEL